MVTASGDVGAKGDTNLAVAAMGTCFDGEPS
jgi:hypothetical protein